MPIVRKKKEGGGSLLAPLYTTQLPQSLDDVSKLSTREIAVSRGVFTQRNTPGHHDNEDRLIFHKQHYKVGDYHAYIGGLCDGHDTHIASQFCADKLPPLMCKKMFDRPNPFQKGIVSSFESIERELTATGTTSGACVLANLFLGQFIVCCNLGDCRSAYVPLTPTSKPAGAANVLWLSRDMKASAPYERDRIHAAGGTIIDGRTAGVLEPSRTIGDADVKQRVPAGVISILPEFRICDILSTGREAADAASCATDGGCALMITGTDGIWDEVTAADLNPIVQSCIGDLRKIQEAMSQSISKGRQAQEKFDNDILSRLAQAIVQLSVAKGSTDDCTCEVMLVMCPGK